jgi:uncharacterized tellurite resistance protein B-like protein
MFETLKSFFAASGPERPQLDRESVPVALATLLVRIAKADKIYLFEEIRTIDDILQLAYDMSAVEAAQLRAEAERIEPLAPATEECAGRIRDGVEYDERLGLAVAMWDVVMADGVRKAEETEIVRIAEGIFGVVPDDIGKERAPDAD